MRRVINHWLQKWEHESPSKGHLGVALFLSHLAVIAAISWVLTNDSVVDDRWGVLFVGLYLLPTALYELSVKKDKTAGSIKVAAALIFVYLFLANDGTTPIF